jgi:hypothetical protein
MADLDRHNRRNAAKDEARALGYRLEVEDVPNRRPPLRTVVAYPIEDDKPANRRFLCRGEWYDDVDALEAGLEVLRHAAAHDHWPADG